MADLVGFFHRYFDLVDPSAAKFPLPADEDRTGIDPFTGTHRAAINLTLPTDLLAAPDEVIE